MIPVRSFVKLSDKELASYQTNGLLDADMIEYKSYLLYKNVFEKVKRELRSYKKSLDGCNVNEAMANGMWLYALETAYEIVRDVEWYAKRPLSMSELSNLANVDCLLETISAGLVTTPSPLFTVSEKCILNAGECGKRSKDILPVSKDGFKDQILEYWANWEKEFISNKPAYILREYSRYFVKPHTTKVACF